MTKVRSKSNYISLYIEPRRRGEFDAKIEAITKATSRKQAHVLREVFFKCLDAIDPKNPRAPVTVTFNL